MTGIVYDPDTLRHEALSKHPERPERVIAIIEHLNARNLLTDERVQNMGHINPASKEDVILVHSKDYVNALEEIDEYFVLGDTYFNNYTYESALLGLIFFL